MSDEYVCQKCGSAMTLSSDEDEMQDGFVYEFQKFTCDSCGHCVFDNELEFDEIMR